MRLVGLSGKMHSGKDTVAEWLCKNHKFIQRQFATHIRVELIDCGFPPDWLAAKNGPCRALYQAYGAAWRDVNPLRWIERLLADLNAVASKGGIRGVVISDVRFPEEIEELGIWSAEHSIEFTMIRLERMVYSRRHLVGANDESETALDTYKFEHVAAARSGRVDLLTRRVEEILCLNKAAQ